MTSQTVAACLCGSSRANLGQRRSWRTFQTRAPIDQSNGCGWNIDFFIHTAHLHHHHHLWSLPFSILNISCLFLNSSSWSFNFARIRYRVNSNHQLWFVHFSIIVQHPLFELSDSEVISKRIHSLFVHFTKILTTPNLTLGKQLFELFDAEKLFRLFRLFIFRLFVLFRNQTSSCDTSTCLIEFCSQP